MTTTKAIREKLDTMTVPPGHVIDPATKYFLTYIRADVESLCEQLNGARAAIEVLTDEVKELQDRLDSLG